MDAISQMARREEFQFEENKRMNAERDALLSLIPDTWQELKQAFSAKCSAISAHSHSIELECEDVDENNFHIDRIRAGFGQVLISFGLDRKVPRVVYQVHVNREFRESLDFTLCGSKALLARGRSGVIIPFFVSELIMRVVR